MIQHLTHHKATISDVEAIINLLVEDDLGKTREQAASDPRYLEAFYKIDADPNQYLMVVKKSDEIVGTCHLTLTPSLTFIGSTRMQIEAVRVAVAFRGHGIGQWMIQAAIKYGKQNGAVIIHLTTNKKRLRAKQFYERLGFDASHEGMKLYLEKES
jgi:GNAT superfamily N-acetyltransferase